MPTVSAETLRQAAAEYATGLATLDKRLRALAEEHERLVADKRVTLGAKFAIDRLLESLEDQPAAGEALAAPAAPATPAAPEPLAPATVSVTPTPAPSASAAAPLERVNYTHD